MNTKELSEKLSQLAEEYPDAEVWSSAEHGLSRVSSSPVIRWRLKEEDDFYIDEIANEDFIEEYAEENDISLEEAYKDWVCIIVI